MFNALNNQDLILNLYVLKNDEEMNIFIAEFIRKKREELGLSQRELARRCGVSNGTISMIEGSRGFKQLYTLKIIASIIDQLDVDIDQFWDGLFID